MTSLAFAALLSRTLAVQLVAGALLLRAARPPARGRRRRAVLARATRSLDPLAAAAAGTAVLLTLGERLLTSAPLAAAEPPVPLWPGALTLLGAFGSTGCAMLLGAGRLERRGRWRIARRLAREGGFWAAGGDGALAVALTAAGLAARPPGAAAAALGGAAALALLAGLSAKPRPAGTLAALAHLAALVLLCGAGARP